MTDSHYWHLANRKLSGTITADEDVELREWIALRPENRKEFEAYEKLWLATQPDSLVGEFGAADSWKEVERALAIESAIAGKSDRHSFQNFFIKIAASVTLLLGLGYFTFTRLYEGDAKWMEAQAGNDKAQVVLPDQSNVWLNKNSRIRYPEKFSKDTRRVVLSGEAFFDVQRDETKPFVIEVASTTIRVLGTSFNVRYYENDSTVDVSVVTGAVNFSSKSNEELNLKAGEAGTLDLTTNKLARRSGSNANFRAWQNHILQFKSTSVAEIITTLENYYDVNIEVEHPGLNSCIFTGTFEEASFNEVLKVLELSLNIHFENKEDLYIVNGEGCAP